MSRKPIELDTSDGADDGACLLVGHFFQRWAALESQMNTVIENLFEIETDGALIITANLKFIDKLHIISTALQWQGRIRDDAWRTKARKTIRRIGRLNNSRNLMAHNLFGSLTNGCIRFYKVQAKGTYDLLHADWSQKDFQRTYDLIDAAYDQLKTLSRELKDRKAIVKALSAQPTLAPMSLLSGLGQAYFPDHQPQSPPGSQNGQATQEINPQMPASPQAKS
jgi:hypothetical protein